MQPQQDQNYWQPTTDAPAQPSQVAPVPSVTELPVNQPELPDDQTAPTQDVISPITWQASEFVHHEKSASWFFALAGVAVVLLVLDVFLIKSWTFGILIVVMAVAAIIVARRPPRILTYTLSPSGVTIDEKTFAFRDFRAFGVVQESAFYSLRLIPIKRFMPMVSVYFPPEHGEEIVDLFGSVLPMEQIKLDPIDKLVEKIRF